MEEETALDCHMKLMTVTYINVPVSNVTSVLVGKICVSQKFEKMILKYPKPGLEEI